MFWDKKNFFDPDPHPSCAGGGPIDLAVFRPFWGQKIKNFKISQNWWGIKGNTRRPKMTPLGPSIVRYRPWGSAARLARDTARFWANLGHFWPQNGPKWVKKRKNFQNFFFCSKSLFLMIFHPFAPFSALFDPKIGQNSPCGLVGPQST